MNLKTCIYRLLCLALALALALSLGGCGKKGGFFGVADLLVSADRMPSPEKDPAGFLRLNAVNTLEALKARYAGSPLAALAGVRADSGVLSLTLGDAQDRLTVSLSFDRAAGRLGLDAAGSIHTRLYADPDFFGVSLPEITGGTYYGFAPADVYSRASGSVLGGLLGEEVLTSLKELEGLLDGARSAPSTDPEETEKRLERAFNELISASQVTVERSAVQYGDKKNDGCILTVDTAGAAASAFQETLQELFPALKAAPWEDGADFSPAGCRAVFVANGCLLSLTLELTGVDGSRRDLALELFAESGETLTLTRDGETVTLQSRPTAGENGWSHTLTLNRGDTATVLTTAYEGDSVSLSLEGPETSLRLSGELHVTDSGFTFENGEIVSGQTASAQPLSVSFTAGGAVEKPTDTADIFSLDEAALSSLLIKVYTALEKEEIG